MIFHNIGYSNAYVGPDILPDPNVFFMPHSKDAQTQVGLSYNFHGILSQCIVIFLFCVHIVVECEIGCKVSILEFSLNEVFCFSYTEIMGLQKKPLSI